ncbi:uncharacterized protein PG986_012445 [Apiospora aurea]|uniref:Uncharacterized protein n=1 Tax=Apiospora aurea TaxID=335848 RepID=A0ABR1Q001_9PEZI
MKSFFTALVSILAFSFVNADANAPTNITQILNTLPDGGYIMDMGVNAHGLFDVTDLDGNPVPGSPFTIDLSSVPPPGPANGTSVKTKDQWGCTAPGEWVDWNSWKAAGSKLAFWCGAGNMVPKKKVLTWIYNGNMAYICNYAGPQNCDGNEYWNYMQAIADKCSFTGCGWFLQGSGDKSYGRGLKDGKSDPYYICYNT